MRKDISGGFVYRDGKRWRAGFTVGYDGQGRQKRRTVSGRTKAEALSRRNALLAEILAGRGQGENITVEGWLTHWLDTIICQTVRPLTLRNYKTTVRRHLIPAIGAYRLEELGPEEVRELHAFVRATGVSERTVEICHNTLSAAMRDAVYSGVLQDNPCKRVRKPRPSMEAQASLSTVEVRRVLATAWEAEDPLAAFWSAALLTGSRLSELRGWEVNRLDLDAGLVDQSWQLQALPWACGCGGECVGRECTERVPEVPPGFEVRHCDGPHWWTRPKTSASVRVVPLVGPLVEALRWQISRGPANRHGLVWCGPKGGPLSPPWVGKQWGRALDAAGVRRVRFHAARHSTSSLLLEAGVTPEVIRQILGHSSVLSTRHYMHVSQATARSALGELGGLMPPLKGF